MKWKNFGEEAWRETLVGGRSSNGSYLKHMGNFEKKESK